ncbi:MAG: hypothetical protein IV094_01110, partial [Vitreoscilla sp.]|nr:hypothetical protein [Vitreoscilla sp.]
MLPLGALAAGFGLAGLAGLAQAQTAAPAAATPATTATAPGAATGATPADGTATTGTLPVVRARASAERPGKESVQATTTRIGKGTQELRDVPQ